jgi:hypothetical protein
MFGRDDLKALVECAGQALKDEDAFLTQCAKDHGWNDGPMGLRASTNERYYQFVIWRALMRSSPWRPQTERLDRTDLVLWDAVSNKVAALSEIKGWWSTDGILEIPGIQRDIAKLRASSASSAPGVMLILTHNPKDLTEKNLDFLAKRLSVSLDVFMTYKFDTPPWYRDKGTPVEFVVIGFLTAQSPLAASA